MSTRIRKRSGHQVPFEMTKIFDAVDKAFNAAGKKTPATFKSILSQNSNKFQSLGTVERIQDELENLLLSCGHVDVYKKFSTYRGQRAIMREMKQSEVFKSIVNLEDNDITNDNANMSAVSPAGMMYKFGAESTKAFAKRYVLDPLITKELEDGYIHIHDLDHAAFGDFNCIQSPMDKILKDGFSAHHGAIRGAKRIETAAFLMMISLETSQNEMFGGQGIPAFDFYLAPFVRLAYEQEIDKLAEVMDWSEDIIEKYKSQPITEYAEQYDDKYVNIAMKRVVDRVHQSMESFVHNANSIHSRGGNQTVFSSINYGTDTSPEGRCIIREILRACMEGVGNGATAIFPIHIFKCKEGVNKNPGDPNYDLYKMSWPVTARRFFPNYINLDASFYKNDWWKADDPNRYIYEPATMGALAGKEHLYIKIGEDIQDITIQDLFEYCKTNVLKSKGDKHIQEKSGIEPGAGVYAITYIPEDVTYIGSSADINRRLAEHRCNIRLTGKIDAGFNPADRDLDNYKFEVLEYCENYKECEKQYIESTPNINFRGTSNKYYKSGNTKFDQHVTSRPKFVQDLSKKQELINIEHLNIKVLDRNNQWTLIKHIFKNDKHNSPYMMHIYYMEHGKEFCLSCTEDHPLYNGEGFTRADQLKVGDSIYRGDGLEMKISKITWHWEAVDSYDIGTASGSFVGSDIIMHNCRTSVFKDRFLDYPTTIGRGNLSFTTINLPMLALDAAIETGYYTKTKDGFECVGGGDLEERKALFFKKLDKYCDITAKQLHDRYEMQAKTKALQYPLVMSRLYIGSENLKRNSEVREAIKHGTLSIGFVGLAEALIALTGKHHGESEVAQEIGLHIVEFIYKKCQDYSEQYDLNYSCFATPAESVAGKMEHITAARYGKIKDITDHGYFTNSNHVPVWYHCTPKHKAEIEGPYHKFTTAGHIFYVEADADLTKNPEAVDAVNRMAWANDVGYNAINHVSARCPRCSYEVHDGSDAPDHCPKCGEKMDKLARITGYLSSTVTKWNSGKIAEFKDRVIHE